MVRRRERALGLLSVFGVLVAMGCGGNSTSFGGGEGPSAAGSSGVSAAGAGGSSGSGGAGGSADAGTGGSAVAGPNIEGKWAMIGFEDPVAVGLAQQGTVITGYGCCAGLKDPGIDIGCCGYISDGSIVDRRARFGFIFEFGEVYEYAADVTVSTDGQRMFGPFSRISRPTAWVRIDPVEVETTGFLSERDPLVSQAVRERAGSYALTLVESSADGSDYSPDAVYELSIRSPLSLLVGDFGPFWGGEMSWLADEETLVVGPVPETDPSFPIALGLRFEGIVLTSVEARMASGARYLFNAALD